MLVCVQAVLSSLQNLLNEEVSWGGHGAPPDYTGLEAAL